MKTMKKITYLLLSLLILFSAGVQAQDEEKEEKEKPRPQRKAFESSVLIDNQSDVVNSSKTLEWNIQHRFGTVENGIGPLGDSGSSLRCSRKSPTTGITSGFWH